MTRQRKDMLVNLREALEAPADPPQETAAGAPTAVGGPFAAGVPAGTVPTGPQGAQTGPRGALALSRQQLQVFGVLQLIVLAAVFFLGRASVGSVPGDSVGAERAVFAAEPYEASEPESASEEPREPPSDLDAALFDPANAFTIMAITYPFDERCREYAWDTWQSLREAGLPVFMPRTKEDLIILMVGAAPRQGDLADMLQRLRRLESDQGQREFESAYVTPIDTHVDRNR